MDLLTLAMAKAYTDQKAGYVETKKTVLTFDGDLTGKDVLHLNEAIKMVKLSDNAFEASDLIGFTIYTRRDTNGVTVIEETSNYTKDKLFISTQEETNSWTASLSKDVEPVIQCLKEDFIFDGGSIAKGLYVGYASAESDTMSYVSYVSKVEFVTEIVHTIDPKFLPGVCLPVVDLIGYEENTNGEHISVYIEGANAEILNAAMEQKIPCFVKFSVSVLGVDFALFFELVPGNMLGADTDEFVYYKEFGNTVFIIVKVFNTDRWALKYKAM